MKMVKKFLLGLTVAAVTLAFSGCKPPEAGNFGMISTTLSTGSIDYTNDGTVISRGFKPMKTQHLDAICHIQMTKKDLVGNPATKSNGVMGYVFNLVEDDDAETKSFTVAGIRYLQDKGLSAYVETFKDVENSKLETTGLSGTVSELTGTGLTADSNFGKIIATQSKVESLLDNDVLNVWIEVVANGKYKKADGNFVTPVGRDGTEGTYTVYFYLADPKRDSSATNYDLKYNKTTTRPTPLASATVAKGNVFNAYDSAKGLTSMQAYMGCYANVYAGQTLKGTWEFLEIKKEAEEIEE